ncbi:root hair initiation protein root hairless 1 [Prunus dulcis]|uniref:Root hair initiation protein root hairless 1 n=1 Tax=Prunus dulcis TaxID=3755 RepID=A0A4Y1RJI0_PRUDU|nr:root hair initiation protein root hairless 1 [Prunus dulcis]
MKQREKEKKSSGIKMARTSSSKKKRKDQEDPNPEVTQRKRLKALAFCNNLLSEVPAKTHEPLTPSNTVVKHHGKDILKKSQRKNRFLFSFPGLLAPIGGGKIGELKDLGTKNPVLYLDFPQGRMKLFGTIVFPKNRYLTMQFPRGGKSVMCEDYFDNMIIFSDAWWIGTQAENPEEAQLDFPKELTEGQHAEYDFKGGAGSTSANKQSDHYGNKDLMRATPVRHSARTAGKQFNFGNASSGDDSFESDTYLSEGEDGKIGGLDSSSGKHAISGQKSHQTDSKKKVNQDGRPKEKAKTIEEKDSGGKSLAKKKQDEVEEDDIEEFSSSSRDTDLSDEDWAA